MTEITDKQRAAVYRELVMKPELGQKFSLQDLNWLREEADRLDSPEAQWLRSLPWQRGDDIRAYLNDMAFDAGLSYLRLALCYDTQSKRQLVLDHAQLAAACLVDMRGTSGTPLLPLTSLTKRLYYHGNRDLLRFAMISLLYSEAPHAEKDVHLRDSIAALYLLFTRLTKELQ